MLHKQNQVPASLAPSDKQISGPIPINIQHLQQQIVVPTPVPPPIRHDFAVGPHVSQPPPVFSGK